MFDCPARMNTLSGLPAANVAELDTARMATDIIMLNLFADIRFSLV